MNNLDVAGILRTYAEKATKARDTKHLRDIALYCGMGTVYCQARQVWKI